jgi:hypothetical protein
LNLSREKLVSSPLLSNFKLYRYTVEIVSWQARDWGLFEQQGDWDAAMNQTALDEQRRAWEAGNRTAGGGGRRLVSAVAGEEGEEQEQEQGGYIGGRIAGEGGGEGDVSGGGDGGRKMLSSERGGLRGRRRLQSVYPFTNVTYEVGLHKLNPVYP